MTVVLKTVCEECKHFRGLINSWRCGCDAFPDGYPQEFLQKRDKVDITKLIECNNGFHFEPKEE